MVKIHMMCGARDFGKDWVHVDRQVLPHVTSNDIYLTGMNNVDLIYCSHGIAYFDREEIIPLLQAWKRALKPTGKLYISTPDWDVLRNIAEPLIGPLYGKMSDPPIYHKTVYNYFGLYMVLRNAGFINIVRWQIQDWQSFFDQSSATYDDKLISLNVKCNA